MLNIFINLLLMKYLLITNTFDFCTNLLLGILKKLDCDTRINVYIGITGILVAVVIFIAEIVSDKKIEVYKKLMLNKTNIVKNVKHMIVTLIFSWMFKLIEPEGSKITYILCQTLLNILILYSTIETFKMFVEVIKLNTSKEYFDDELKKYVYSKMKNNAKNIELIKHKLDRKNRELMNFISKSKVFHFESNYRNNEYNILESNTSGYIESYNYHLLNKIEENLLTQIQSIKNDNYSSRSLPINIPEIYICKKIGDKCSKGFSIAYYKNVKRELINLINQAIVIDKEEILKNDNEICKIITDFFSISFENILEIDTENMLKELYEFLCYNNYESIILIFLNNLDNIYSQFLHENKVNESFIRFLIELRTISIKYNRYEDFKKINLYVTWLYIKMMNFKDSDLKHIAYKYSNNVYNNYYLGKKSDSKYYDLIMSNLLLIIKEFIKRERIDAVLVIFDNIFFDKRYYNGEEFTDKDVINFQFVIAIIYFLLYQYEIEEKNGGVNDYFINEVSNLIDVLEEEFLELYDMWDVILKFNKYSKNNSEINHVMESIELDSEEHKYKNSWVVTTIDINNVLKCMIYMFDISYVEIEKINKEQIKREEKYKYEKLKELFSNNSYLKLEEKYNYKSKYKPKIDEVLNNVISIADEKEKEYELNAEIDIEKINKFKEIIIRDCQKKSELEELIYRLGKCRESNEKIKRVKGIAKLIPRSWFIKDEYNTIYTDHIAEEYGMAFQRGMKKEIIQSIKKKSIKVEDKLEDMINKINNSSDYILLTNRQTLYNTNYKLENDYLIIDTKRIRVLFIYEVEGFILINQNSLPIIEICDFDDFYEKENIFKNIYIKITDCSQNEQLRNEIISNTKWLKEKGGLNEQNEYLKEMCDFKVFKAYKIIDSDIDESYIFEK